MKIDAQLTYNTVRFDQENDAHLVVTVTAPDSGPAEDSRAPLCIVPLIDVSPSMAGAKLVYAKRSLIKLIDHLSANDYCGLVAFSGTAQTLSKPVKCTPEVKEDLKRKVQGLALSGATNIADALLEGFRIANSMDLASEVITRVILFTDGAANVGPAKTPKAILELVAPNIGLATVSAFGYGEDAVQDFLSDLAKSGSGNYSFVQNPDDALTAFGKELGGLLSTHATNLMIDVSPLSGHEIVRVVSDVDAEEEESGQVKLKVADILCGETRNFVLAVKLRAQKAAFPRAVNVFDVRCGFDKLDETLRRVRQTLEVKAKGQFVKPGEEQAKPTPELDQVVGLAQVVRAQLEAEEHAKRGDFSSAINVMECAKNAFDDRGLDGLGKFAESIGGKLSSRGAYVASQSYLASTKSGATRGYGGTYEESATVALRGLGVNMSNSSQTTFAQNFSADDPAVPTGPTLSVPTIDPTWWDQHGVPDRTGLLSVTGGAPQGSGDPIWNGAWVSVSGGYAPPLQQPLVPVPPASAPAVAPEGKTKRKRKISQKSRRW
jgi:Ca-activated chloride channel family protein